MKKVLYLISVIAATTMFVTGCNENEDKNEKATLQAFAKTGCKSSSSATRNGGDDVFFPETIRYEATADGCLLVNHVGTDKLKLYIHNFQNEHASFTFDYSPSIKGEWTVE